MTFLRNVGVYLVGLVLTAIWATRVVLRSRGEPEELKAFCERAPRLWAKSILRSAGVEVQVKGGENIDPERPQIVVANHASWFDVFALAAYFPGAYHFVAKEELARIPIFGRAWISCGHISIDRSDLSSAVASLETAAEKIRSDDATIIMFPEGTRSPTGELQRFKKGAFVLALKAGVPVVPLAITGSRGVMPKGRWLVRPGRILIRVGRPISTEGYTLEQRNKLVRDARSAVAALLREEESNMPKEEGSRATRGAEGEGTSRKTGAAGEKPEGNGVRAGVPVESRPKTTSSERER